jgi:hypothetical protein
VFSVDQLAASITCLREKPAYRAEEAAIALTWCALGADGKSTRAALQHVSMTDEIHLAIVAFVAGENGAWL